MANTLGGVQPAVIADLGFESFKAALAPLNAFATDLSGELANFGSSVTVHTVDAFAASTEQNAYETAADATTVAVTVTLNKYQKNTFYISDIENDKNKPALWEEFAREAGYAVAAAVFADIWSQVTLALYGAAAFTGGADAFDADAVADIMGALNKANVSQQGRSLILSEDYWTALCKDNAIQNASASGSAEALREGALGRISGFSLYRSNAIPGNSENLVGGACVPAAMAVAMRPLKPQQGAQEAGLRFELRTDPATGLSIGYRDHYSLSTGKRFGTFEVLYGYNVAKAAGLKRLISA